MKQRGYGFNPDQLHKIRKEKGMTQHDLAEVSGITRVNIVRYEQGASEPRMATILSLARELEVDPKELFLWPEDQYVLTDKPESSAILAQNLSLLANLDLKALKIFADALASSDNPLDYDQDLHDRDLAELQSATPEALRRARAAVALTLRDLSHFSGLPAARLGDLENSRRLPVTAFEIMALRRALGVLFEPRALTLRSGVLSNRKDRREPKVRHQESVQEWLNRCQRTPNKIEILLHQVAQLTQRVQKLEKPKSKAK
mgnify:CR=1 FL=1